jgi:hypothetical protein
VGPKRGLVFHSTGEVFVINSSAENVFSVNKRLLFTVPTCAEARDLVNM